MWVTEFTTTSETEETDVWKDQRARGNIDDEMGHIFRHKLKLSTLYNLLSSHFLSSSAVFQVGLPSSRSRRVVLLYPALDSLHLLARLPLATG